MGCVIFDPEYFVEIHFVDGWVSRTCDVMLRLRLVSLALGRVTAALKEGGRGGFINVVRWFCLFLVKLLLCK